MSLYQSYLNIKLVLGYVGYYVLGYYLKEYTLSRPAEYSSTCWDRRGGGHRGGHRLAVPAARGAGPDLLQL